MVRGNNRSTLFQCDRDRLVFLRYLEEALEATDSAVHAYVLMTNHVHLLATGRRERALSRMIQAIGRRYARFINRAYQRTGTLFEGRFLSSLVDSDVYFLTCMRYIELNPVRAFMVSHAGAYRWSSYHQNVTGNPRWMLTPHGEYLRLGDEAGGRGAAYQALVEQGVDVETLDLIRRAAAKGGVVGDQQYERRIGQMLGRSVAIVPPGRPRRQAAEG
jgi:putative transposase